MLMGTYSYTIIDSNNCIDSGVVTIPTMSDMQIEEIITNISCDGFCDGTGADWGINFSCSEWQCDGCDCAGQGQNSDECIEECGSAFSDGENNNNILSQLQNKVLNLESKEFAHTSQTNNNSRDLLGYIVYKDNVEIAYTTETEYLDTEGLWYLTEYCYNVVADYDEGTSGFSNTAC